EMADALRRAAGADRGTSTAATAHAAGSRPRGGRRMAVTGAFGLAALGLALLIRAGFASWPDGRTTSITPTPGASPSPTPGGGSARPDAVSTQIPRRTAPAAEPSGPAAPAIVAASSPEPSAITAASPGEPATTMER